MNTLPFDKTQRSPGVRTEPEGHLSVHISAGQKFRKHPNPEWKSIENGPRDVLERSQILISLKIAKIDGLWPRLFTELESVKSGKEKPICCTFDVGSFGPILQTWKCACTTMKPWKDTMCEQLSNWKIKQNQADQANQTNPEGCDSLPFQSKAENRSGPDRSHAIWHSTWLTFWPHGTWAGQSPAMDNSLDNSGNS